MTEPTREQIKEAFEKTIERWERIVENVEYWLTSECDLCKLGPNKPGQCTRLCPISQYGKSCCSGTPYWTFDDDKTPENALAELNFLRKVYIWWMEKEAYKIWDKHGIGAPKEWGKEDKPEEWVDVTGECYVSIHEDKLWIEWEEWILFDVKLKKLRKCKGIENFNWKIEDNKILKSN